ncbi:hypothetical protein ACLBW0_19100 [Enterobacteriaceae bacterium C34A]
MEQRIFQFRPHLAIQYQLQAPKHTQVTAYNLNLILALIYQFEDGIAPVWGQIRNGSQWSQ